VVERLKAPASKAGVPDEGTVSSNLTLSAISMNAGLCARRFMIPRGIASTEVEQPTMTVMEQLATWAATPEREMFVGVSSGDNPYQVQRIKIRDVTLLQRIAESSSARAEAIRGVHCVVVELPMPDAPDAMCRVVLSPVEPFS
jgi:hypothetical protein